MTTKDEIENWFDAGAGGGYKFLMVYCDTYDYSDYPVYVKSADTFWEKHDDPMYTAKNMQKLVEVYDLSLDKETQMEERCAYHPPARPTS